MGLGFPLSHCKAMENRPIGRMLRGVFLRQKGYPMAKCHPMPSQNFGML